MWGLTTGRGFNQRGVKSSNSEKSGEKLVMSEETKGSHCDQGLGDRRVMTDENKGTQVTVSHGTIRNLGGKGQQLGAYAGTYWEDTQREEH